MPRLRVSLARWRPEWRPSGDRADRLALLALAMVAFKFSNWQFLSERIPGRAALLANFVVEYVAFLLFCGLVALTLRRPLPGWVVRNRPHRLLAMSPLFAPLALLVVVATAAPPVVQGRERLDDANVMAVCGARAISAGADPYRVAEIPCLAAFNLPPTLATPLRAGPLQGVRVYPSPAQIRAAAGRPADEGRRLFSPLGKPPLTPAVMVPVAHLPTWARTTWTLLPSLVLLLALAAAAGSLWPAVGGLFLLTFFLNGSALNFAANGNAEAFAYVLMALSILWVRRPVLSAVCIALAVGSNQLAWFLLPGYVLLAADSGAWVRRLGAGLGTLVVAVVPWLVRYPDGASTIFSNLTARTFPLGSGPITLVLGRFVPPPSRTLLLALTAAAVAGVFLWGLTRPRYRVAAGVLVLAGFWLSWRSLDEYMAQIPLLALAAIVALHAARQGSGAAPGDRTRPEPGWDAASRLGDAADAAG